jgi:hypothetical protein
VNIPTPTIHTQHSAHQHTHTTSTTSSTPLLTTHRRTRVQLTLTARMRYRCRYGPRVAYLRDGAQEAKGGVSVPAPLATSSSPLRSRSFDLLQVGFEHCEQVSDHTVSPVAIEARSTRAMQEHECVNTDKRWQRSAWILNSPTRLPQHLLAFAHTSKMFFKGNPETQEKHVCQSSVTPSYRCASAPPIEHARTSVQRCGGRNSCRALAAAVVGPRRGERPAHHPPRTSCWGPNPQRRTEQKRSDGLIPESSRSE